MTPTRPILRYHGGKWRLAPWIISHFPKHRVYVEPFAGAASVLLRKPRSDVEVINDKYGRVVNLFRVLRVDALRRQLNDAVRLTPCAIEEFYAAREISDDPVEDARRMLVLGFQGHGSTSACGGKQSGWRRGLRSHGGSSADEWRHLPAHVKRWAARLRGVFIENGEAVASLFAWDAIDTLHYVDPPYVRSSRSQGVRDSAYAHEMSDAQHRALALTLHSLRGMIVLSGYRCALYDELFGDWHRVDRATVADKGLARTESLWLNPAAAKNLNHV